jgi:hypothetical protein
MIGNTLRKRLWQDDGSGARRRGGFMILGLFCLMAGMTFVAFSVDIGMISLTKTRLQNGVDAAALAGAMEITYSIENADDNVQNVLLYAQQQAAATAAQVADLNGIFVDPNVDVTFGHRWYDEQGGEFHITWGGSPPNVVRVRARRDNPDLSEPDGQLPLLFAGVNGDKATSLWAEAVAYVEARDIVTVLDFSRSMNFDSYFASEYTDPIAYRPQAELEENMHMIWEDLGSPVYGNMGWTPDWVTIPTTDNDVTVKWMTTQVFVHANDYGDALDLQQVKVYFANGANQTFTPAAYPDGNDVTYQGTSGNAGQRITKVEIMDHDVWETIDFYNNDHIKRGLGLTNVAYPWPVGSWDNFIAMCREHSSSSTSYYQAEVSNKGYRRKFGLMLLIQYVMRFESGHNETPDLWMTRHYPFHSVKEGQQLFCDYLEELNFGDHVGLVSYDTNHRVETTLSGAGWPTVNISAEPITVDYQSIRDIIEHKQAAHYSYATNMGGGLKDAKNLLITYKREGARPTILLMTDGNTNTMDSGESSTLPTGWSWSDMFDYNNDGVADYSTTDSQKKYALKIAKQCVDLGYTVHTMSVGADADTELMEAIAFMSKGIHVSVPGGTSVSEMQEEVLEAFRKIAAFVPPAKLLSPNE